MGDLTKYFNWSEARCRCGNGCVMSTAVKRNVEKTAQLIESHLRIPLGLVKISSWVRCAKHNDAVGGSQFSRHLYGDGVDIHIYSERDKIWWPGERIAGWIEAKMASGSLPLGGVGTYRAHPFMCHVDFRGTIARWWKP